MASPSSAFQTANAKLDRRPRIIVGFREPGADDWRLRYTTGSGEYPYVTSVGTISSSFDLSTLTYRIGDATVGLLPGDGGPISQTELFAQGADAWREVGVLVGFDDMAEVDFLAAFSGYVVGWPSMNATEFSVRATDGMDLVRRMDRATVPDRSMWAAPLRGQDITQPIAAVIGLAEFMLATGAGLDPNDARMIDPDDVSKWLALAAPMSAVDTMLLGEILAKRLLPKAGDPKKWLEGLLPAHGCFLSRYAGGVYRLAEIRPRDKADAEQPSFPIVAVIDDQDIVSVSAKWAADDRVRSVTLNYGLLAWDSFDDVASNDLQVGVDFGDYSNDDVGKYLLSHRVEVVPYAGEIRRGVRLDGRDVTVDAAGAFMAQADLDDDEVWDETGHDDDPPSDWSANLQLIRPGRKRDTLNFPVRYDGFRRGYGGTDWTIPLDDPARLPSDHVHTLHQAAARILRAGFLPSMTLDLVIQARKGATLSVGDAIQVGSAHLPNTVARSIGLKTTDAGTVGQVLSIRPDPMAGTVAVSVRLPMLNPTSGAAPFWTFSNEVAHWSGTPEAPSENGWNQGDGRPNWTGDNDRPYATGRAIANGAKHEGGWADVTHSSEAVYWLYTLDRDHIGPAEVFTSLPRAIACESYDLATQHAFHYVRLRCSWSMMNTSITTGHWVATVRLTLLSGEPPTLAGDQTPLAVEWSEIVEIPFRLDGQLGKVGEFTHSICCPGLEAGPKIRRPDPVEEGGTIRDDDASHGATKGDVDQEYLYTHLDRGGEPDWVSRGVQVGDAIGVSWLYWNEGLQDFWPFWIWGTVTETNVGGDPYTVRFISGTRWSWYDDHPPNGETGRFGYDKPSRWSVTLGDGNAQVSETAGTDRPFIDFAQMAGPDGDLNGIQAVKMQLVNIEKITDLGRRTDAGSAFQMGPGEFESHVKIEEVELRRLRFGPPLPPDEGPGPGPGLVFEESAGREV